MVNILQELIKIEIEKSCGKILGVDLFNYTGNDEI